MGLKIISAFDGMACGMISFIESGYQIDEYVAFEIDKYAIKTATHNFPNIKEMGDMFAADFTQYKDFDFLIGGSPCTYWSIAQTKNRETVASGLGWELFQQFVRALRESLPRLFIYENNKSMSSAIRESITETFGFEPICINSALLSAQNRERLYWVGIRQSDGTYAKADIEQPSDLGILLKDELDRNEYQILLSEKEMEYMVRDTKGFKGSNWNFCNKPGQDEKSKCLVANLYKGVPYNVVAEPVPFNPTDDGKSHTLTSSYYKISGVPISEFGEEKARQRIAIPVSIASRGRNPDNPSSRAAGEHLEQRFEARTDGKSNTVTSVTKDYLVGEPVKYAITSCPHDKAERNHKRYLEQVRVGALPRKDGTLSTSQALRIYSTEGKSVTITGCGGGSGGKTGLYAIPIETDSDGNYITVEGPIKETIYKVENGLITVKGRQYPIKLIDGFYIIRKLTVSECMRLQTVPEWYEFPVSNTQAYKMLGNGWTCRVIMHLINSLPINKEEENESI